MGFGINKMVEASRAATDKISVEENREYEKREGNLGETRPK